MHFLAPQLLPSRTLFIVWVCLQHQRVLDFPFLFFACLCSCISLGQVSPVAPSAFSHHALYEAWAYLPSPHALMHATIGTEPWQWKYLIMLPLHKLVPREIEQEN